METYGLVGYPLGHSFSKKFFTEKFQKEGLDAEYVNFEIADISMLPDIIKISENLRGLNVTIPYKEKVFSFLDELDSVAQEIGAINVIRISHLSDGRVYLKGYNSDVIGFQKSISPLLNKDYHKKALILGTGGASKAVAKGLSNLGLEYKFVSRSARKDVITYQDLTESIMAEYKVIINSTPLGTYPDIDSAPEIPYQLLTEKHLLYDLVYNPSETTFLKKGAQRGAQIKNGYEMLELQALAAWDIWQEEEI